MIAFLETDAGAWIGMCFGIGLVFIMVVAGAGLGRYLGVL